MDETEISSSFVMKHMLCSKRAVGIVDGAGFLVYYVDGSALGHFSQ